MFRSAFIKISWVGSYSDWALNWTWGLISKIKYKQQKCEASKFLTKNKIPSKIYHGNPSFPFYQNSAQLCPADHLWFVNEATKSFLVSKELVLLIVKDLTV